MEQNNRPRQIDNKECDPRLINVDTLSGMYAQRIAELERENIMLKARVMPLQEYADRMWSNENSKK